MSFFVETGALVNRAAVPEDAFHRVDRLIAPVAADSVDHLNHRAIQTAQQTLGGIFGQFATGCSRKLNQAVMGGSNLLDTSSGRSVQT